MLTWNQIKARFFVCVVVKIVWLVIMVFALSKAIVNVAAFVYLVCTV